MPSFKRVLKVEMNDCGVAFVASFIAMFHISSSLGGLLAPNFSYSVVSSSSVIVGIAFGRCFLSITIMRLLRCGWKVVAILRNKTSHGSFVPRLLLYNFFLIIPASGTSSCSQTISAPSVCLSQSISSETITTIDTKFGRIVKPHTCDEL